MVIFGILLKEVISLIGVIDVGGGLRGIYGAGVFDFCLDNNINFDYGIGVSAGSANIASFLGKQKGRNLKFYSEYIFRKEYMSFHNLFRNGSYIDLDYVYSWLSNSNCENPLNYDGIIKSNSIFKIVATNSLTGDTIYIDKPIQQHSLIQTISRVNRVYEGKEKGLVVDYIGIKSNMNLALKKYGQVSNDNFEGTDEAIVIVKDQLDLLTKLFYGFNANGYFNGTPLEQLQCLNKAVEFVQQTEDVEKRFMTMSKKLNSAYRLCCTCEEITSEEKDKVHFYLAIKSILHKLTKGDAPDAAQMNEKVREMINEAIISEGVEEVFKLDKNDSQENDDIFSDEYLAKVNKISLPNTRIKLLKKLLNKAISEFKRVNKVRGIDFSKRLKALVDLYNERKDFESMKSDVLDDLAEKLADLFKDIVKEKNSSNDLGISFEEKAFYDILKSVAEKHEFEYPHDKLINLAKEIKEIVDDKAKYTDWATRDDIKAELKVSIILTLDANDYPPVPCDEVFKEIFEQAENFKKYSMA